MYYLIQFLLGFSVYSFSLDFFIFPLLSYIIEDFMSVFERKKD